MERGVWVVVVVLLGSLAAGCIGAEETDDQQEAPVEPNEQGHAVSPGEILPLGLSGEECVMAGGHSVHPRNVADAWHVAGAVPEPWQVADVIEDVGQQVVYSEVPDPMHPVPEEGETWGHYHSTIVCETWWIDGQERPDLLLGFVGPRVETPGFAESTADHEYLATVLATNDEVLYERLQRAGVHAMWAEGSVQETADQGMRVYMSTDHNGEYLSIFKLKELGQSPVSELRLWSQHENVDGTFTPLAVEMTAEGGTHFGAEGQGYFHHARTGHHYPLPGAYGKTAAFVVDGFDMSLTLDERPGVVLEEAYVH